MKKRISVFFIAVAVCISSLSFTSNASFDIASEVKSAILIEPETGTVLYEKNPDEKLSPASVTKIMTALLVMEAIDSGKLKYDEKITVSSNASGMGGSQIFLETGETICVSELLEGMMVASGNDAAVAFAEAIGGTEDNFVGMMNAKAVSLGLKNTHFMNCHGLDEDDHYTCARDIAAISIELLKHRKILDFTSIWTDSIRGGKTALANTNKLVRFYEGCDGLKTGSTSVAKCCISATAEKNGMRLIAVVMAAPTTDMRFAAVRQMFDYGFAVKEIVRLDDIQLPSVCIKGGQNNTAKTGLTLNTVLVEKGKKSKLEYITEICDYVKAPVKKGDIIGKVKAMSDGKEIFSSNIVILEDIDRVNFGKIFTELIKRIFMHCKIYK